MACVYAPNICGKPQLRLNGNESAIIVTRFAVNDDAEDDKCIINVEGLEYAAETEVYLLDESHDLELVRKETFTGEKFGQILNFD